MREQVHELNRIPTEFHEDGAPELPPLPDEFNRYPRRAKTEDRRSRLRRSMLLLAASGLTVLGILFPHLQNSAADVSPERTAVPGTPNAVVEVSLKPLPTDAPTPAPTTEPTPIPTPEPTPEPGADPILIQSSLVFYAAVQFSGTDRIEKAAMRLWDPNIGETAAEHAFTREEIDAGVYRAERFDANGFGFEHGEAYAGVGREPELVLETTVTYRTEAGEETVVKTSEPEIVPWVNVNFDTEEDVGGAVEMMYGTVYPNCFVVRIERTETDRPQVVFGDDPSAIGEGGVLITVSVNGVTLTGVFEPVDMYADVEGDKMYFYPVYAVPLPETFPEHGTAHVQIRQRLTGRAYLFEKPAFELSY